MKMEETERSETSEHKIQTPRSHPKERILQSEQGESLKSRIINLFLLFFWFILPISLFIYVFFPFSFSLCVFLCLCSFHCCHVYYRSAYFFAFLCVTSLSLPQVTVKIIPLEPNGQYSYHLLVLVTDFSSKLLFIYLSIYLFVYLSHIIPRIKNNYFSKQCQYIYFHNAKAAHFSSGRNRNFSYISHEYGCCLLSIIRLTPLRLATLPKNSTLRLSQWVSFVECFFLYLSFHDYTIILIYCLHITTTVKVFADPRTLDIT